MTSSVQGYFNSDPAGSSLLVTNQNSHFVSCQSLSEIENSPRSNPVDQLLRCENEEVAITPLITDDDHLHYGSTPVFRSRSGRFKAEDITVWRRISEKSKKVKPFLLFSLAFALSVVYVMSYTISETYQLVAISNSFPQYIAINATGVAVVTVEVFGPFVNEDAGSIHPEHNLIIALANRRNEIEQSSQIGINCSSITSEMRITPRRVERRLELGGNNDVSHLKLTMTLNTSFPIAFSLQYYEEPVSIDTQVIWAFGILIGVYILIILELVHRTIAAMLGSLTALAFLSYNNKRPTFMIMLSWIQWNTLALLFGMMILVTTFAKTGFFDYLALKAYKLSKGHVWLLITLLCFSTAVTSAVLDNVTVIMLLTPVTVTLCQVLNLHPKPILLAEVIFANIGGTATAIGDPPNVILVSNRELRDTGITFTDFTKDLFVGIFLCLVVAYGVLRFLYRNVKIVNDDPPIVEELKREAEIWKRSAVRLPAVSAEEETVKQLLLEKSVSLDNTISNIKRATSRQDVFPKSLEELEKKYVIRDRALLIKSSFVITLVIVLFFIQSFVPGLYLEIGWIAVLGALLLILLADISHFEDVMEQVEWTTLVFFAALFILMESLRELGLMDFLGSQTSKLIETLGSDSGQDKTTLAIAVIIILWVSALVSSFIDNIPFTTAMIPVMLDLSRKNNLCLPPLVWALAMGSCLGGNGTLIGASANVVCAGLAEQYGYPITFNDFFKVGFRIMLATTATATIYLLISQVWMEVGLMC